MVYCNHCRKEGKKIKLEYDSEDIAHPFFCPECKNEDWFIDDDTGTIKENYSETDYQRMGYDKRGRKINDI